MPTVTEKTPTAAEPVRRRSSYWPSSTTGRALAHVRDLAGDRAGAGYLDPLDAALPRLFQDRLHTGIVVQSRRQHVVEAGRTQALHVRTSATPRGDGTSGSA